MKVSIVAGSCVLASVLSGCGTAPPPSGTSPAVATSTGVAPTASATAPVGPVVQEPPPPDDGTGVLQLQRVQQIWSLFEVVATEGTVELRLGYDPGGGQIGNFRYVPLVDGVPQLAEETAEVSHADTTGGILEIAGKRPNLVLHVAAGFRSGPVDSYLVLGEDNGWERTLGYNPPDSGTGMGLSTWSGGRLLEWRQPSADNPNPSRLPMFGVARGTPSEAPSLPRAMRKRLDKEGFYLETYKAFPNGEIVAVGRLLGTKGFGTVVWKDKPAEPTFAVTEPGEAFSADTELTVLGGTSLADVRLRVGDSVMSWSGAAWAQESVIPKGGLPDVWFGTTMVIQDKAGTHLRFSKDGAWRSLAAQPESIVVDAAGVVWATDGELLLSSKKPAAPRPDITERDIVSARKASILRGGSRDATGKDATEYSSACSMHYVLLEQKKGTSDGDDYAAIRKALTGHDEFAKARFIVSRERGRQFFGALLADDNVADKLVTVVGKAIKGSPARSLCAEPPAVREVKIDLASGALLK